MMSEGEYLRLLGARVAEFRKHAGLSVQDLADKIEVPRMKIYRVESGKHSTGIDVYWKIAEALGIEFSELVKVSKKKK